MKSYWQLWPAALSPELCQELIDLGNKLSVMEAMAGNEVRKQVRRSRVSWIKESNEDFKEAFDFINQKFLESNEENFNFDITHLPSLQFTRYLAEEEGHYDWHEDTFWITDNERHRKLSMVIQLSDPKDYEGGILQLYSQRHPEPPREELQQRGSIIVFPSFLKHRVIPVTRGIRYSLVGWIEGPQFR